MLCQKQKLFLCIKISLCKIWRILDIGKTSVLDFKFERLKILEIQIELGPACQSEPPSNRPPGCWRRASVTAVGHAPEARAPSPVCSTPCSSSPLPTCAAHLILSMPRPVSCSPPCCAHPFPSPSCCSALQSPPELPPKPSLTWAATAPNVVAVTLRHPCPLHAALPQAPATTEIH
jgi:hypothetical protein